MLYSHIIPYAPSRPETAVKRLPHVENHSRIFRAAYDVISGENMSECRKLIIDAFMNDPLVKGHNPSYEEVTELVDDMVNATSAYLPASYKHWKD